MTVVRYGVSDRRNIVVLVAFVVIAGTVAVGGCSDRTDGGDDPTGADVGATCATSTDTVDFTSRRWGRDRAIVHLTGCPTGPVDVIYLLHGANADRTQWIDVGVLDAVDSLVAGDRRAVAVVIPDADGAYRCRERCEEPIADYVLGDLEALVDRDGREVGRRLIAGISRGGQYALGVAATRPDDFVAVAAHSPANIAATTFEPLAGTDIAIWLDVGDADPLAASVVELASMLAAGSPTLTATFERGAHDRAYWRSHVPDYATWYLEQLADRR